MFNPFSKYSAAVHTAVLLAGLPVFTGALNAQTSTNETAEAQAPEQYRNGPPTGWGTSLGGGYVHQFENNIDTGGSFSKDSALIQAGVRYAFTPDRSAGLSVGYGFENYDFSGPSGLGGANPWNDLHTVRIGAPVIWGANDQWKLLVIPSVRFQGELDATLGDSLSGGGFVGFSYKFNDRLTIGPGFGAVTQLEDNPSYFPVLIVDWQISEKWSFSTGRGLGATLGPGLVLAWKPLDDWRFGIGARYEKFRFRLNDNRTVAPSGVGEDRNQPVFLTAEYSPNPGLAFSLIGGAQVGGKLSVADQNGTVLSESDYDTGGFVGFTFNLRF